MLIRYVHEEAELMQVNRESVPRVGDKVRLDGGDLYTVQSVEWLESALNPQVRVRVTR